MKVSCQHHDRTVRTGSERDHFVLDCFASLDATNRTESVKFPVVRHATQRVELAGEAERNRVVKEFFTTNAALLQSE